MRRALAACIAASMFLAALCLCRATWAAEPLSFEIRLDAHAAKAPISGRLYVFLSRTSGQPRFGPSWFRTEPFFRLDVEGFEPGTSRRVDDRADGFPGPLSKLEPGEYRAVAHVYAPLTEEQRRSTGRIVPALTGTARFVVPPEGEPDPITIELVKFSPK